jgi:hypothetical protein
MKRYIKNALAKFIFGEDLPSIKAGIKIAQMPMKAEDTTTPIREDINETLHDHESRIGTCEDHEYSIDEIRSEMEDIKSLAEQTEEAIDKLNEFDFAVELTEALKQPAFTTLIEIIIANEREKAKKKKPSKKKKA